MSKLDQIEKLEYRIEKLLERIDRMNSRIQSLENFKEKVTKATKAPNKTL